jgi:hypothetical protein
MQTTRRSSGYWQNQSYYARSSPGGKKMWRPLGAKLKLVAISPSICRSFPRAIGLAWQAGSGSLGCSRLSAYYARAPQRKRSPSRSRLPR